jgi:hypothetical protein
MDTAKRLLLPQYYNNSRDEMIVAMCEIKNSGCDFLVAGRVDSKSEEFEDLCQLKVPRGLEGMFRPIEEFRNDISSTSIRKSKLDETTQL